MNRLTVKLMLDCGVFSAYRVGQTINVKDYARFIKRNLNYFNTYVTLDVLPFSKAAEDAPKSQRGGEHLRSEEDIERAAAASDYNHQYLKDQGLNPLPVFHMGEKFKWLDNMLKNEEKFIGVSTVKAYWNKPALQERWLDQVYSILCNTKGEPLVKTHGFGVTSPRFLYTYPFNTVDSTTWSQTPGYGTILIPEQKLDGTFDFSKSPRRVSISGVPRRPDSSPKWRKSRRNNQIGFGELQTAWVQKWLEEVVGITVEQARDFSHERRRAMLVYYQQLAASVHNIHFNGSRQHQYPASAHLKPVRITKLKMVLATTINNGAWADLMTEVGANHRLLSYWELRKIPEDRFIKFIETGLVPGYGGYTPNPPKSNELEVAFRGGENARS